MKEYQEHLLKEIMNEIEDHLSMIKDIDGERVKMSDDSDLHHAQCAYKHIKFLKAFIADIEKCMNT